MYMKPNIFLISHLDVFLYTMNSFKCSKCLYNTTRNYDLTRHLKGVHGIYVNTSFKGYNHLQTELPRTMSEERQYEKLSRMEQEEEESSGNEPRFKPEYTEEQIERLRAAMRRNKCEILDCVLNILPTCLRSEAKRICDSTKENPQIFINDKHEVIIRGRVKHGSNILTLIIDELVKSPGNFKEDELQINTLKCLLAHQTKALERKRGIPICEKLKSMFDGSVKHFDDSDTDSDSERDESDVEDDTDENEDNDEEDDSDRTEEDEEEDDEDDKEDEEDDKKEDDEDMDEYEEEDDKPIRSKKKKKN